MVDQPIALDALIDAAREVGARAASAGEPLGEVLDRFAQMQTGRDLSFPVVRALASTWSLHMIGFADGCTCHDPLTSLGSLPHLRARLDDLYRRTAHRGGAVSETHALVVVDLGQRRPLHALEESLDDLEVGQALSAVFPAHETMARLSGRRAAAVVEWTDIDDLTTTVLERLLADAFPAAPRVWVESLPDAEDAMVQLVSRLTMPVA